MRRRLVASVLLLLLAAGLAIVWLDRGRRGTEEGERVPAADPGAFDLGDVVAGFDLDPPRAAPTGPTFEVGRRRAAGTAYRTSGSFRSVQRATGRAGPGGNRPPRAVWGSVAATTNVEADGPESTRVVVDGDLRLTDAVGDAPPRERRERFTLAFDVGPTGAADPAATRLLAPEDLRDLLGTLVVPFTEAVPLPDRPLRVGDSFDPTLAIDVDPWRRTMWEVFQKDNPERPPVVTPVEGRVWVAERETYGGEEVVVVRTALNHAHAAEAGPFGADAVRMGYAAAERSERRIALSDGLARSCDLSVRRRVRAQGKDFDTTVDSLEHVVLTTTRGP